MALKACCRAGEGQTSIHVAAALGLPTQAEGREYKYRFLADCTYPKLFLSGDSDQFAPAEQLVRVAASSAEPRRLVLLPGADHFFTGQLEPMQQAFAGWLKEQMP